MRSLSWTKCVTRVLMGVSAIAGLLLTAGCGSGSPAAPNNNGFTAANLNGTYVFSTEGADAANGTLLALTGYFTANGTGGITGGTIDVIDPAVGVSAGQSITPSNNGYSVSSDGRARVTLASAPGTFTLDVVLTTTSSGLSSHGLVTEFDTNGSGSGTLDLQTAVADQAALAGPYAFSLAGADASNNPFASTGAFTLNASGGSTAGIADFNRVAIPVLGQGLSVSALLTSGTGPGTASLLSNYNASAMGFDFYPIDAGHWKMIETDGTFFLAGDVFTQTGASTIPSGAMVFTMAGGLSGSPLAAGGLMTSDGTGNFPSGSEDLNIAGTATASLPFSGVAAVPAGTGGRVLVDLTGFSPASQWVIYPSSGGILMMESDVLNITTGVAFAQTATSFSAPAGYGLNLTGQNTLPSEVDTIAQFNATTATSNNMSGVLDENDEGSLVPNVALSGTYTPDSPATGRGTISATANGTFLGGLTLEYYTVTDSTAVFIEVDSQQLAVGSFEAQTGVTPGVAGVTHRVGMVARPFVRTNAMKKTK